MDKERQQRVIDVLKDKGAIHPCPRCHNLEFEILGESRISLVAQPGTLGALLGHTPHVPVIVVSCNRCGYIASHAKGLLDLQE
jgi:predicted nucleic-acid-binding Zn-ribbon protein